MNGYAVGKYHPANDGGLGQGHRKPILILLGFIVGGYQLAFDQRAFYIADTRLAFTNSWQRAVRAPRLHCCEHEREAQPYIYTLAVNRLWFYHIYWW